MNPRKNSFGLSALELRNASYAASQAGMPFTAMLTVHYGQIDEPIGGAGAYLRRKVINRLGIWFRLRQRPWVGAWVRENYAGVQREHVHVLLHLPRNQYGAFRIAVQRWCLNPAGDLRPLYNVPGVVGYVSKQMTPQAHFSAQRRIRRERECRHTGSRVAPVLGKHLGLSRRLKQLLASDSTVMAPRTPTAPNEENRHALSKSTWWAGVKDGRYPKPVKLLGPRITAWRVEDIRALIERSVA